MRSTPPLARYWRARRKMKNNRIRQLNQDMGPQETWPNFRRSRARRKDRRRQQTESGTVVACANKSWTMASTKRKQQEENRTRGYIETKRSQALTSASENIIGLFLKRKRNDKALARAKENSIIGGNQIRHLRVRGKIDSCVKRKRKIKKGARESEARRGRKIGPLTTTQPDTRECDENLDSWSKRKVQN